MRIVFLLVSLSLFSQSPSKDDKKTIKNTQLLVKEASQYLQQDKYELSLNTSRLALYHAFKDDNFLAVAKSYTTIAGNYEELAEFKKALFYYKKALTYADKTTNDTIKYVLYNRLGTIYSFKEKQYDLGLFYYKKHLASNLIKSDFDQLYKTNLNLARVYFDAKKFKEGKNYLDFINSNQQKNNNVSNLILVNTLNGMYYNRQADFTKAASYFSKALVLGESGMNQSDYSYAVKGYAQFLFDSGAYKKAYTYLDLYHQIESQINEATKINKATVAGINLEIDEYKRKLDKIEVESHFQAQVLEKTKIISFLLIICLLILLLFVYTLYRNYNLKKTKNLELTAKNLELELSKEKAEAASKLKSQFVSTITHELRTPLYGVIGITDMLVDEHKELADSPHLKSLKFSAKYLLALVNDVLQINKIEENRIVLEKKTFNISDEIEFIKDSMSFLAKKHQNVIEIAIDPAIPEYLIGDKLRFSQIIINLVSNALKFTQNGTVSISANLVEVKDKLHFIAFNIRDTGVGIAKENQEKIFDKFVQLERKEIDYQGTGLGLPIVKQLLKLFDSTISLESEPGKGTTFNFTIPFEHDKEKTNAIINNINVDLSLGPVFKILIVDDNVINLIVTKKTIEKFKYKCATTVSGKEALDLIDKEDFDVVLMDINMPEMNGFETTKLIRKKGIKTPIIALTAFDKEEVTEEAISAGFDDIISKPFDSEKLYKTINETVRKN